MPLPTHDECGDLEASQHTKYTHRDVNLPEVSRNAIILPLLGEGDHVATSSSSAVRGSEDVEHQRNGVKKNKKKHSSSSSSTTTGSPAIGEEKSYQGEVCEAKNKEDSEGTSNGDAVVVGTLCAVVAGEKAAANNDGIEGKEKAEEDSRVDGVADAMSVQPLDSRSEGADISGAADTPSRGREGNARVPVSPVSAIRAKVGGGLRNLLSLGSEAQVSPASASPQHGSGRGTNTSPSKQRDPKGLSPLSWSRLKSGRVKKEPAGNVAPQALFGNNSPSIGDIDDGDNQEKIGNNQQRMAHNHGGPQDRRTSENDELATRKRQDYNRAAVASSRGLLDDSYEGIERSHAVASKTDEAHHEDNDGCLRTARGGENLTTDEGMTGDPAGGASSSPDIKEAATTAPAAVESTRKVLARDNTLIPCDEWPEVLDDEADPADWALGESEGEVLAAARRNGSLLVRVVTWNLHAKPTPAAEKLREALLPPGKVSGCFSAVGCNMLYLGSIVHKSDV